MDNSDHIFSPILWSSVFVAYNSNRKVDANMNFAKTVRVKSRWLQCHQKKHLGWSKHFLILLFNEIFSRNLVCKRFRFSINISDLTSNDFGQIVLTYTDSKSTVLRSSQRALRRGTTQYTLHSCCQHSQKKPLLLKIIKLSYFFSKYKLSHELMMHRLHNCSVL